MNTENNILIAEFLGHEIAFRDSSVPCIMGNQNAWTPIKYHSDWNWLMQVIEKILSINLMDDDFEYNRIYIGYDTWEKKHYVNLFVSEDKQINGYSENSKIEAVYNACVEFIKWYNEQKGEKKD